MDIISRDALMKRLKQTLLYDRVDNVDEAVEILHRLGEYTIAAKLSGREWSDNEKDKVFVQELIKSLSLLEEPEIVFNPGRSNTANYEFNYQHGIHIEDELLLVNNSYEWFHLDVDVIESKYIRIKKISRSSQQIRISFFVDIRPKEVNSDVSESLILVTNYKTYIYRIHASCAQKVCFSEVHCFKTLDEFFALYCIDPAEGLKCFVDARFHNWLNENLYDKESAIYESVSNNDRQIALQNFLLALNYDIVPQLHVMASGDFNEILISNKGKGYLFGNIVCSNGIVIDKSDWSGNEHIVNILKNPKGGVVQFFSNGGYRTLQLPGLPRKTFRITEKKERLGLMKGSIRVYLPETKVRVNQDNNYIKVRYKKNKIILRRNITLIRLLLSVIRKKSYKTNLSIVGKDEIKKYQITILGGKNEELSNLSID